MKTIGMFEAKAKLSEICQSVAQTGEPVVITRRGVPLVSINPVDDRGGASEVWDASDEYRRSHRITEDLELPSREVDPQESDLDL